MANVGEAVRRERERLGLSQVELAVRMGFPRERQSYVSDVERGNYIPSTLNLLKFAQALAVDIQQLVSPLEVGSEEMGRHDAGIRMKTAPKGAARPVLHLESISMADGSDINSPEAQTRITRALLGLALAPKPLPSAVN